MTRRLVPPIATGLVVIAAVAVFGLVVARSTAWTAGDLSILRSLSAAHNPVLDAIAVGIDWLFAPPRAIGITVVVAVALLAVRRDVRMTIGFVLLVAISWLGSDLVKAIVHRPRPDSTQLLNPLIVTPGSYSYPSGHVAFAASLGLALVVIAARGRWRNAAIGLAVVMALATAWSRAYLGVHYVTDVVAALVYTAAAVALLAALSRRFVAHRPART